MMLIFFLNPIKLDHPSASTTPCRNIVIHGYCKYMDKGCAFNHDSVRVLAKLIEIGFFLLTFMSLNS